MTGGTLAHDTIKVNLRAALVVRLRGTPRRPHGSDVKIKADGSCFPVDKRATIAPEPVVTFEAPSPSTADVDRIELYEGIDFTAASDADAERPIGSDD